MAGSFKIFSVVIVLLAISKTFKAYSFFTEGKFSGNSVTVSPVLYSQIGA
jgi:hypothetical protein